MLLPTGVGEEIPVKIRAIGFGGAVIGWLPGERQYIVVGALPGKRWQCFAWDAAKDSLRAICPEGIADAYLMLSPDRQWLLGEGPDGGGYAYPVQGGEPRAVRGLSKHDTVVGWRNDNRSIFIVEHRDSNKTLPVSALDIVSGERKPWKELRPAQAVDEASKLRITPDGSAYVYNFRVKLTDLYVADGLQ
jgi:hypothetical protein